jgi:hypothetical protein
MPAIGKDSTGDGIQYHYRGIEAIKAALKPLLGEHGLTYRLVGITDETYDTVPVGDRGKVWQRTRFKAHWLLRGPDGDELEAVSLGVGVDSSDKAENKAVTTAEKQMLLTTFCVADSEDPDNIRPEITTASMWPARTIKGGMITEIARHVTGGDLDRARTLAVLAWDILDLAEVTELPADEARDKIAAAVELARQEGATDVELARQEGATDVELDVSTAPGGTA